MNLAKNDIVTLASSFLPRALSLDYTNKRVYWITRYDGIFSGDYDGENTTSVKRGRFNYYLLGIFEDSVYFQKWDVRYINAINRTSGIISHSIKVDKTNYRDLVIVHNSLQPMGELQKIIALFLDLVRLHIFKWELSLCMETKSLA